MASQRDYYDILGVPRGASDADIKRSFRKLAQQWHPDVSTEAGADERFKEINEAYQVLSDPQRRQAYDTFGHAGVGGGPEGYGPFGGFQGFGDLFDAFFGQGAAGASRRGRPPAGADLRYDLRLTFAESIAGAEKEIEFSALGRCETCSGSGAKAGTTPATCPQCNGSGEVRNGPLHDARPDGQRQRLPALQRPGPDRRGALHDLPRRRPHGAAAQAARDHAGRHRRGPPGAPDRARARRARAAGRSATSTSSPTSRHTRACNAATPSSSSSCRCPSPRPRSARRSPSRPPTARRRSRSSPGTQPGTEIRLRGKGVPHLRRSGARGDLHVLVDVKIPTKLTKRQRELLAEFAAETGESGNGKHDKGLFDKVKDAIS